MTRNGHLHALVLGWREDHAVRLTALGGNSPTVTGQVRRVTLQGGSTPFPSKRTPSALEVAFPDGARPRIGLALVIAGARARPEPLAPLPIDNDLAQPVGSSVDRIR